MDNLIFSICRGGRPKSIFNRTDRSKLKIAKDLLYQTYAVDDNNMSISKKRNLVDPSIIVAALGLSPSYFNTDFKTLGFLFESLCIRDLKIYSSKFNGYIDYYHNRYDLEVDGTLRRWSICFN